MWVSPSSTAYSWLERWECWENAHIINGPWSEQDIQYYKRLHSNAEKCLAQAINTYENVPFQPCANLEIYRRKKKNIFHNMQQERRERFSNWATVREVPCLQKIQSKVLSIQTVPLTIVSCERKVYQAKVLLFWNTNRVSNVVQRASCI